MLIDIENMALSLGDTKILADISLLDKDDCHEF